MDKGQGVCTAVRSAHHDPDGRELVVLQRRGLDLRPKARKRDEHDHRECDVGTGIGQKWTAKYHGPRRMLVAPGLRGISATGGAAISNRQKTGSQYLGDQPGLGGLRGNGNPTTPARTGYRQERFDQNHWAAAG